MNLPDLPASVQTVVKPQVSGGEPESQRMKILWLSLKVVAIFATLFWLDFAVNRLQPKKQVPVQIEPKPYEFHIIEDWYHKIGIMDSRRHVEALLGPPSEPSITSPELTAMIPRIEWTNRHIGPPPGVKVWVRWIDPHDSSKAVTILFNEDVVWHKMKTGFDEARP